MSINKTKFAFAYVKNRLSVFKDARFVLLFSMILVNSLNLRNYNSDFVVIQIPSNAIVTKEVVVAEKKKSRENKL